MNEPPPDPPAASERVKTRGSLAADYSTLVPKWCLIVALSLSLTKLILVSHDETLAYPDDDFSYVYGASILHWGVPYQEFTYSRQPVYNLFLASANLLGFPVRLWIEFVWIGAAAVVLFALRRLGLSIAAALTAFALVLFHPWTMMLFNRFLSDSLYGAFLLVFLSSMAVGVTRTTRSSMIHWGRRAAIFGSLAANTRVESVLIFGAVAVAALCILGLRLAAKADHRLSLRRAAWIILLPLAAIFGLAHAIKFINFKHIGIYATNDLEGMPGFNKLYGALIAIRPARPDLRLSVPRDVRDWAYARSPTFAQLRPFLESDPVVLAYAAGTEQATGVKGEYGAWTVWALRAAAWRLHPWPTARELNAFYSEAGEEILTALKAEPGAGRWAPVTFVPPEWGLLVQNAPVSLVHCWRTLFDARYTRLPDERLEESALARVNAVGSRRESLIRLNNGNADEGSAWQSKKNVERLDHVKQSLAALVRPLTFAAVVLIGMGTVIGVLGIRRRIFSAQWYVLSALLLTAITGRLAIFTLMDATGYAVQMRFMFPLAAPLVMLAVLNAEAILSLAARGLRKPPPQPPHA